LTDLVPVAGLTEGPFEPLRDVFARVIGTQEVGGGALAVYRDGRPVVDLVAGDYRARGVQLLFSVTKAVTAIAAAMVHERGLLDLDAPLADQWPAFDRPSTRTITTRMVLTHRSGLAALERGLALADLVAGREVDAVETQEPYWEPDTRHGYHAFTYGPLVDGMFVRAIGQTVSDFVASEVAPPLGLDLWLGIPDEVLPRVEPVIVRPAQLTAPRSEFLSRTGIPPSTTSQIAATTDLYNDPAFLRLGIPSTCGVGGARDLARLFAGTAGTVDGVRLLSEGALRTMVATRSIGMDAVLGVPTQFGSGVQLPFPQFPMLSSTSFGHEAAGGSAAFADAESGLSVGFTTSVYPPFAGASVGFLALMPTIRHCLLA